MTTTRAEHVRWCKQRARQEYEFYLPKEGEVAARSNAIASMISDLGKHEKTRDLRETAIVVSMTVTDERSLFRFIDGFAE